MPTGHSDRNSNCPYTMQCELWDTNSLAWTPITIPASPGQTCVDTEGALRDTNSYSCKDYADNPDDSVNYPCDGSNNGGSGFDAATMCC